MTRLFLCLSLLFCTSIFAQTKVVVIPMAGDAKSLQNVLTVSKENGDFTSISSALNSIEDSSESNPYLVVIGPGHFTETILFIPNSVTIAGSGTAATFINFETSPSSLADRSIFGEEGGTEIRDLSITLLDSSMPHRYLYGNQLKPSRIANVDIVIESGAQLDAVFSISGEFQMTNVSLLSKLPNTILTQFSNSNVTIRNSEFIVQGPFTGDENLFEATNALSFTLSDTKMEARFNDPFKDTIEAISHNNTNRFQVSNLITRGNLGIELNSMRASATINDSILRDVNIVNNDSGRIIITDTFLLGSVTGEDETTFCDNVLSLNTLENKCVLP